MPDLFGFQGGYRLAKQDQLQQQLGEISIAQGKQQLEQGKVNLDESKFKLQNAQLTLERQNEMLKLLKERESSEGGLTGGAAGTPSTSSGSKTPGENNLPEDLDFLAEISMKTGFPEEAAKYAKTASEIKNNSSLIESREFAARTKQLTFAAGLLEGVNSPESWAQANAMYELEFGQPSPFKELPYDPETVNRIRNSVTTQREKSLIEAAEVKAKGASLEEKERQSRIKLNEARLKLTETREKALNKAGGTSILPKSSDVKIITNLMTKEFAGAALPEEFQSIALPIAERMLSLMKEQNLSKSEASVKAFEEARENGDLGGLKERRLPGGSRAKPFEMPAKQEELKPNMYYLGKGQYAGQVLLWTGKGFRAVLQEEIDNEDDQEEEEETSTADSEEDE